MSNGVDRVVLVHIYFPADKKIAEDLDEFQELASSAGAEVVALVTGTRSVPDARYFVGKGKAAEVQEMVASQRATLAIFNHALTPAQERNLERLLKCRVLDRTGLILDIFAQRARSFEGKLQVELALLQHLSTRLVRGWTHLERQRGGIGLRGPGETQLETDRRLLRNRMKVIKERLVKLRKQRAMSRRARRKAIVPTVALVGYTNAGKSTLFNYLSGSDIYVADQLFATLDPTLRRINLPEMGPVILADTVGFIRHIPHSLVEAFHATLEEVSEADLLLHVIDASDKNKEQHSEQVEIVLKDIGAENVPRIKIYNKIDLDDQLTPALDYDDEGHPRRVYLSAVTGLGIGKLVQAVTECLGGEIIEREIILTPKQAKLRADLYKRKAVLSESIDEEGCYHLLVRMLRVELEMLFG